MLKLTDKIQGPIYKFSESENDVIKQGDIREVQVLREGDYTLSKGQQVKITQSILLSMVSNFDKGAKPNEPSIDFVHDSANKAAAWVKKLFTKMNSNNKMELWANAEITGAGAYELSQKNFKYTSADFTLNYVDNETLKEYGPLLEGLALTNRPVIKGMQAIMLSEKTGVLDMTLEEALAMIEALKLEIDELKKKLPKAEGEVELSEDTPKTDLEVKLSERIKTLETASKEMKFNELLAKGKIAPAQKEAYLKGDMDTVLSTAQPIKFSEVGSKASGSEGDESLDDQIAKVQKENPNYTFSEAMKVVTRKNKEKMNEDLYKGYKL